MKPRFTLVIIFCFVALFLCRAQELAALRPWLAFDRYEQYKASFYSGAGKLSALPGGGKQLTGEARTMILRDRKFTIGRYQAPQAALVDYGLQAGSPLKMVLAGTADGKPFRTTPVELSPGG